jgi:glycosyltransferase involved in cell wall biosynthesis
MKEPNNILQVCTYDVSGGAEKIACDLAQTYRQMGYRSTMAVGFKRSNDPGVVRIPNSEHRNFWARTWSDDQSIGKLFNDHIPGSWRVTRRLAKLSEPRRIINEHRGREDFDYPGTQHLLSLSEPRPDILHCHNLHGYYFDLRMLPGISREVPVVLTMHDAWLLSGHCAHSFDCERWKAGCGNCPDLTIYPAIKRDATASNFKVKADIYRHSRLYVAAPCQWLLDRARQSMLSPGIVDSKVIPNGVNLDVFHPYDRALARKELGLPADARILLFIANRIRKNIWKDYDMLRKAISIVAGSCRDKNIIFLALGEKAPAERIGNAKMVFIPFQKDPVAISRYYQAADVYVHAARIDTFPNTILEAMACGTPVVATAVGGIPEQIEDGNTGFLVSPGDASGMARRIVELLSSETLQRETGERASRKARGEYDLRSSANSYLQWYRTILQKV